MRTSVELHASLLFIPGQIDARHKLRMRLKHNIKQTEGIYIKSQAALQKMLLPDVAFPTSTYSKIDTLIL